MKAADPFDRVSPVVCPDSGEPGRGLVLQAQRMEAIGQVAGGIARDFNDALTVITGYSQLLLDSGQLTAEMAEQLRQVYAAGVRAGNLMRQLLIFSRKHAVNKQPVDLNQQITDLTGMLGRLVGKTIRLEVSLAPGLPALNADPVMMEQILMNLSLNARDAMPEGGVLAISTATVVFGDGEAAGNPDRRPGKFVCLAVSDTGCGMTPGSIQRIFEPFYTTKAPGVATGLGLATVFGIVQEHSGWIEVESQPGAGSRFRVYLPPGSDRPAGTGPAGETSAGNHNETILLVEDDAPVRDFIVAVLNRHGYRILQAGSGVDALEVWKWYSPRIALLLTDMVIPDGMSGLQLAEQLKAQKPALKVVLMSGYTSEMVGQLHTGRRQSRFIQKPIRPDALARIVREALDEPSTAAEPVLPPPARA